MTEGKEREESSSKVIGYCLSEKKSQKLNWHEFENVCKRYAFQLVKLNLNRPLEGQGPFSVILHKLTDVLVKAASGDSKAKDVIDRLENYTKAHPEVVVIDPLTNVRKLLHRYDSYCLINQSNFGESDIFTPKFVELKSTNVEENISELEAAGVQFPFVCKPSTAQGQSCSHRMAIIFNEEGVKDCKPPCVAQSFINHNAVLYKIYLIGDEYHVVKRPSIKNFHSCDHKTIYFDTNDVSKAGSKSSLNILDPEDRNGLPCSPDEKKIAAIVSTLKKQIGLVLVGMDIVIQNKTKQYAIIDINAFPGYEGYPNVHETLANCLQQAVYNQELRFPPAVPKEKTDVIHSRSPVVEQDISGPMNDSTSEKGKKMHLSNGVVKIYPKNYFEGELLGHRGES